MTSTREKLIELLGADVCESPDCEKCGLCEIEGDCVDYLKRRLADHLIANGVTVQEWIPVSEPPILPGDYLCYFEFEPESPNIICENTYKGGRWMEKEKVTHWMPLPELPGGDADG